MCNNELNEKWLKKMKEQYDKLQKRWYETDSYGYDKKKYDQDCYECGKGQDKKCDKKYKKHDNKYDDKYDKKYDDKCDKKHDNKKDKKHDQEYEKEYCKRKMDYCRKKFKECSKCGKEADECRQYYKEKFKEYKNRYQKCCQDDQNKDHKKHDGYEDCMHIYKCLMQLFDEICKKYK